MTQNIIAGSYNLTNLPHAIRVSLAERYSGSENVEVLLKALPAETFYDLFGQVTGRLLNEAVTLYGNDNNLDTLSSAHGSDVFSFVEKAPKSIINSLEWQTGFVLAFPMILVDEDKDFIENVVSYHLAIAKLNEDATFVWENDWTLSVNSYHDESIRSDPDSVVFDGLQEALANGSPVRSRNPNKGTRLVNPPVGWVFLGVSVIKF